MTGMITGPRFMPSLATRRGPVAGPKRGRVAKSDYEQTMLDEQAMLRIPSLLGMWLPGEQNYTSAGDAAQTAVGGLVGRVDNLSGLITGSNVVVNGTFDNLTWWSVTFGGQTVEAVGGRLHIVTNGTGCGVTRTSLLVSGQVYEINCDYETISGSLRIDTGDATTYIPAGSGHLKAYQVCTVGQGFVVYRGTAGLASEGYVDNLTVRAVGRYPATQVTVANKPYLRQTPVTGKYCWDAVSNSALTATFASAPSVLYTAAMGRRNRLTWSEDLTNAAWTKTATNVTRDITYDSTGAPWFAVVHSDLPLTVALTQAYNYGSTTNITVSVRIKKGGSDYVRISYGDASLTQAFGLWYGQASNSIENTSYTNASVIGYSIYDGGDYVELRITGNIAASAGNNIYIFLATTNSGTTRKFNTTFYATCAQVSVGSYVPYEKITHGNTPCTLVRATAEGVTFDRDYNCGTTLNIVEPYQGNFGTALLADWPNRLSDADLALISRVMGRQCPALGPDLFENGSFASDTGWTSGTGWSIGSGVATKTAGTASNLTKAVGVTGKTYYSKYTLTRTAGTIGAYPGDSTTQLGSDAVEGSYSKILIATGSAVGFRGDASFAGTVDDATIREIL